MRSNDARRERFSRLFVGLLFVTLSSGFAAARSSSNEPGAAGATVAHRSPSADAIEAYRTRPMAFELNHGQTDSQVKFLARAPGYTAFLTSMENVLALQGPGGKAAVVRMQFVGANPSARIVGVKPLAGKVNYFRGGNPEQQVTNVPTYARVKYVDLYPGVEMVYYGRERQVEYDFVVAPGADPNVIRLAFEGADKLEVNEQGDLLLHTPAGELRQRRPFVYQEVAGARQAVSGGYVLTGEREVGFRVRSYDARYPLVIDPVMVYSTYLGGSGEEGDPVYGSLVDLAMDTAGNAYVTGTTRSSDFPSTPGADRTRDGNQDAFVTKLSPTGAVLYSTYLGGPCEDIARGIAVNAASGEAYVTGRAHFGCNLAVAPGVLVAKLSSTGAVAYFFTFGGSVFDTSIGQAIAVDRNGHAYVTGLAKSSSRDFPTTSGAFRTTDCGIYPEAWGSDGFVAMVNVAGDALLYSTYLCGNAHDSANAIAIDGGGHAYVTGSTESRDFPTLSAFQPSHRGWGGKTNAFVAKLTPDGADLMYSTYLGGRFDTVAQHIDVDAASNAYVTGSTEADDYPTTGGVLQPLQAPGACLDGICMDAFVTKINAAGSALVYSTYLCGELRDQGTRIAVDSAGNAYVVGQTNSLYFPIFNAFQTTNRGLRDAFVAKLNPDATRLLYSSYLGGGRRPESVSSTEGSDGGTGIALHAATSELYVSGYTSSPNFWTTAGAFQRNLGGGSCYFDGTPCVDAFVTKIAASGPGVVPAVRVNVSPESVPVGGTITASWAGIPAPPTNDELRLYPLGALAWDSVALASWPTTGAASGSVTLTLPTTLEPATYELRLYSPNPDVSGLLDVIARSQPIYVGGSPTSSSRR